MTHSQTEYGVIDEKIGIRADDDERMLNYEWPYVNQNASHCKTSCVLFVPWIPHHEVANKICTATKEWSCLKVMLRYICYHVGVWWRSINCHLWCRITESLLIKCFDNNLMAEFAITEDCVINRRTVLCMSYVLFECRRDGPKDGRCKKYQLLYFQLENHCLVWIADSQNRFSNSLGCWNRTFDYDSIFARVFTWSIMKKSHLIK